MEGFSRHPAPRPVPLPLFRSSVDRDGKKGSVSVPSRLFRDYATTVGTSRSGRELNVDGGLGGSTGAGPTVRRPATGHEGAETSCRRASLSERRRLLVEYHGGETKSSSLKMLSNP